MPPVAWKDPRFQPAIDSVRSACGFVSNDREDDPMIGMLLDRYSWDEKRVCEQMVQPRPCVRRARSASRTMLSSRVAGSRSVIT